MASSSVFHQHSSVLILDYGSQYTQLIARRIRDYGVLSILLPGDVTMVRVAEFGGMTVMHEQVGGLVGVTTRASFTHLDDRLTTC